MLKRIKKKKKVIKIPAPPRSATARALLDAETLYPKLTAAEGSVRVNALAIGQALALAKLHAYRSTSPTPDW